MAEENTLKAGDIVCLKSEKDENTKRKFTVGSSLSRTEVYIHWYYRPSGEFRTAQVNADSLHKLDK